MHFRNLCFASAWLLVGLAVARCQAEGPLPFDLRNQRFLFLDTFLLEECSGAKIAVNPPNNAKLVVFADQPWERGGITSYGNVFWDPEANLYRMYYVPVCWDVSPGFGLAMAVSADGMRWDKPSLGVVEWKGSKDNNLVLWGQREGTVFLDPKAPSNRRYAIISSSAELKTRLFTSPDGIHFEMHPQVISTLHSDSQISSFWNEETQQYYHYPRRLIPGRAVGFVATESVDEVWPPIDSIPVVMSADVRDPEEMDLYTNAAQKYSGAPSTYFAFPTPYYHYNRPSERAHLNVPTLAMGGKPNDGTIETQLATSRDGKNWVRYRTPYLPLGTYDGCDLKVIHAYPGMFDRDGQLVQYFAGYAFTHGDTQVRYGDGGRELGGIYRVEQRPDGFTSLDFDYEGGQVVTAPVTFSGKHLVLNINTSASGEARVAILDEQGNEIPGFALSDAHYINGSHLQHHVTWKSGAELGELAGKPVRIKFVARNTKLYSLCFTD